MTSSRFERFEGIMINSMVTTASFGPLYCFHAQYKNCASSVWTVVYQFMAQRYEITDDSFERVSNSAVLPRILIDMKMTTGSRH